MVGYNPTLEINSKTAKKLHRKLSPQTTHPVIPDRSLCHPGPDPGSIPLLLGDITNVNRPRIKSGVTLYGPGQQGATTLVTLRKQPIMLCRLPCNKAFIIFRLFVLIFAKQNSRHH